MLFLLEGKGHFRYDSYNAHVVRAPTIEEARKYAQEKIADESLDGKDFWLNPGLSDCTPIYGYGDYGIILSSFNAG